LHQKLFVEANPIPVKWALAAMGHIESGIRLPLVPMSDTYHDTLRVALKEAGSL
jgi:4-hydroxy-tetrahydrodipicolinate synthase